MKKIDEIIEFAQWNEGSMREKLAKHTALTSFAAEEHICQGKRPKKPVKASIEAFKDEWRIGIANEKIATPEDNEHGQKGCAPQDNVCSASDSNLLLVSNRNQVSSEHSNQARRNVIISRHVDDKHVTVNEKLIKIVEQNCRFKTVSIKDN